MKGILQNLYKLQTLDLGGLAGHPHMARLRAGIPDGLLINYDRARARGKKGIAVVRNHVCTNCRVQVPVAVTASLAAGRIQVCGNCGLYLCLPSPDEQSPARNPPKPRQVSPRKKKRRSQSL
jgi:predicted  nucleic acid-binding Zn-ribbon protein